MLMVGYYTGKGDPTATLLSGPAVTESVSILGVGAQSFQSFYKDDAGIKHYGDPWWGFGVGISSGDNGFGINGNVNGTTKPIINIKW